MSLLTSLGLILPYTHRPAHTTRRYSLNWTQNISDLSHCSFFWLPKASTAQDGDRTCKLHTAECFASAWGLSLVFCSDEREEEGLGLERGRQGILGSCSLAHSAASTAATSSGGSGEWAGNWGAPCSTRAQRQAVGQSALSGTVGVLMPLSILGKQPELLILGGSF